MAYQMAATIVTLNNLERYLSVAGLFKCNPSNICAAFYTISTDGVLGRFLCISRASYLFVIIGFFRYLLRLRRHKPKYVEAGVFQRGWVTLRLNFRLKGYLSYYYWTIRCENGYITTLLLEFLTHKQISNCSRLFD